MHLIHEQQDLPFRFGDLLEDRFQTLLELAAVFCAGDQRAHIQLDQTLLFQAFRHIPVDDTLRQTFDDRRFTDARLTDQGGIVLGTAGQDLHHPANLFIPPDDRIQLALARHAGQVAPIFFERLVGGFGILRCNTLGTAHGLRAVRIASLVRPKEASRFPSMESVRPSRICSVET
jgi:hypothetical protein